MGCYPTGNLVNPGGLRVRAGTTADNNSTVNAGIALLKRTGKGSNRNKPDKAMSAPASQR